MTWLRLDDRFHRHRKVAPLSDRVWRLHVTGMLECCANETNGKVDRDLPKTWPSAPRGAALKKAITELVERGLWEETETGWNIHDFLEWNISAEKSRAIKKARSQAGKRGGKRSAKTKQIAKQLLEQTGSKETADTEANFNPDPDPDKEPPHSPPEGGPIGCPSDLRLTPGQVATISMNCGLTEHQERAITGHLVAKWVAGARRMPIDGWRKYLATAVQSELSSKKWPKEPPPDEAAKQSTATRWVVGDDGTPI